MILMTGKELAESIKKQLIKEVSSLEVAPKLVVIQVGDNAESNKYISMKEKACEYVGIDFEHIQLDAETPDEQIQAHLDELNVDSSVTGVIVQLPLPDKLDVAFILESIAPEKDVDGLTVVNSGRLANGLEGLFPATAEGVINLLRYYDIPLVGANAVVIGRSNLVGKPIAQMLLAERSTVTVCHSKTTDLSSHTKKADIIISAVGKKNLLTRDMVKEGAVVVDVGMDVDFDEVSKVAGYLTPAIGGVGPMTVAMLLSNVIKAAKMQIGE